MPKRTKPIRRKPLTSPPLAPPPKPIDLAKREPLQKPIGVYIEKE